MTEAELKAEIRTLEKKITNKQEHISKLNIELADMKTEITELKKKRIALLQSELSMDDTEHVKAVSEGLKSLGKESAK